MKLAKEDPEHDEPTKGGALAPSIPSIMPGEPITVESRRKGPQAMFFSTRRYDLGRVGRYKLNKKFDYTDAGQGRRRSSPRTSSTR